MKRKAPRSTLSVVVEGVPSPEIASEVVPNSAPRRRGQPTDLTPRIQQIITDVIRAGNYQVRAAEAAGIEEKTLLKWRRWARSGREPYATLERAIEQADRDCETALVSKVMAKTDEDWGAAFAMLERKYPERWSRYRERAAFESDTVARIGDVEFHIHLDQIRNTPPPAPREKPAVETEAKALPPPPQRRPRPDPELMKSRYWEWESCCNSAIILNYQGRR